MLLFNLVESNQSYFEDNSITVCNGSEACSRIWFYYAVSIIQFLLCSSGDKGVVNFTLSYIFPLIERQIYRRYTYFHKVIKTSQEHFEVNAHLFMYVKMCDNIYENRCGCIKLL
ncbi:hypothetical protein GQX74_001651 [Glossina fuscipes]|nr:hypothetical protein GQX74_001651 [Glossina fuscipes]